MDKLEFVYVKPSEFLIRNVGGTKTPNAFNQTAKIPK